MSYVSKYLFLLLCLLTLSLQTASAIDDFYKIPFVKSEGLMLIEATIDDESGYLIFDTGADALILNRNTNTSSVSFHTVNGDVAMSQTNVGFLSIGSISFLDIEAYTCDLSQLDTHADVKILGIIGTQLFSGELLHIDNDNNLIQVYPRSYFNQLSRSAYVKASIDVIEDFVILPLTISGTSYNFILDTGASTSFIDHNLLEPISSIIELSSQSTNIITAGKDSYDTHKVKLSKAKLANLAILDLELGVSDFRSMSEEVGLQIHGILSLDQLPIRDILIDFEGTKIYVGL